MEYQKLVERLRAYTYWLGKDEPCSRDIHPPICDEAADAISVLLAGSKTLEMFAEATNGVPLNRVREIVEAERTGRLVVLPDARYTDTDGEEALRAAMRTCNYKNNPVTRYTADAIAEKLCREAKEENQPLTLEELREMDGEPVWIASRDGRNESCWMLVDVRYNLCRAAHGGMAVFENCGKTWLAYRRRPEAGRHEL